MVSKSAAVAALHVYPLYREMQRDTKTIDATLTASMDLNGKPKVTVKRAWDF